MNKLAFVKPIEPLSVLAVGYAQGSAVHKKVRWLQEQGWHGVRRVGDEPYDSFYRSVAFAFVERLVYLPESARAAAVDSCISTLEDARLLIRATRFSFPPDESHYRVLPDLVRGVIGPPPLSVPDLVRHFNQQQICGPIVQHMRLLTSAYIQGRARHFDDCIRHLPWVNTLESYMDNLIRFCQRDVEKLRVTEGNYVVVRALALALGTTIKVAYLDSSEPNTQSNHHVEPYVGEAHGREAQWHGRDNTRRDAGEARLEFVSYLHDKEGDDGGLPPITLLFRAGHFEILEPKDAE